MHAPKPAKPLQITVCNRTLQSTQFSEVLAEPIFTTEEHLVFTSSPLLQKVYLLLITVCNRTFAKHTIFLGLERVYCRRQLRSAPGVLGYWASLAPALQQTTSAKLKKSTAGEVQCKVKRQCSDLSQHAFGRTAARCGSQLPTAIYPHRA